MFLLETTLKVSAFRWRKFCGMLFLGLNKACFVGIHHGDGVAVGKLCILLMVEEVVSECTFDVGTSFKNSGAKILVH